MSPSNELVEKLVRVRAFLEREGLGAVLLNTQRNFAWLTCGGSNHVGLAKSDGVAWLLVRKDGSRFIICPNNERPRITDEETAGLGFEALTVPWYELCSDQKRLHRAVAEVTDPDRVGADSNVGGFPYVETSLSALRFNPAARTSRWSL